MILARGLGNQREPQRILHESLGNSLQKIIIKVPMNGMQKGTKKKIVTNISLGKSVLLGVFVFCDIVRTFFASIRGSTDDFHAPDTRHPLEGCCRKHKQSTVDAI